MGGGAQIGGKKICLYFNASVLQAGGGGWGWEWCKKKGAKKSKKHLPVTKHDRTSRNQPESVLYLYKESSNEYVTSRVIEIKGCIYFQIIHK